MTSEQKCLKTKNDGSNVNDNGSIGYKATPAAGLGNLKRSTVSERHYKGVAREARRIIPSYLIIYEIVLTTSAMSLTNFGSIPIFASYILIIYPYCIIRRTHIVKKELTRPDRRPHLQFVLLLHMGPKEAIKSTNWHQAFW